MNATEVKKGPVVAQGKTKTVYAVEGHPHRVIMQSKDTITKNDDPSQTQVMASKAKFSTLTTSRVFELLKKAGIPVAYERQLSETSFLAPICRMIMLEVVCRRYAVGSYLKRYPNFEKEKGAVPHRFHKLIFEIFLKTTGGKIHNKDGVLCGETPVDAANGRPIDDPFISYPENGLWALKHPKLPGWDEKSDLGCSVLKEDILPDDVTVEKIEEIARKVFLVLESAWAQLGFRLIDFKIELGVNSAGELLVADVIDNDSWRLRTSSWEELSKQLFRDNFGMQEIANKYAMVSQLVGTFTIPDQAIVLWRGSESDSFPTLSVVMPGVSEIQITKSGHKSPVACLSLLEGVLADYPQGGVIITFIGMSNGLGPILAARTSWPVIAIPATVKERPHDVWSSLEVPGNVPLLTTLSPKNAILAAFNVLAQKNPVAYMHRQYAIEALDD